MTASDVSRSLADLVDPKRAESAVWFFKPGYSKGDKFLGVSVPLQRQVAKQFKDLPLPEVEKLITSPWHEERLTALFILVGQFQKANVALKKEIYDFYMAHTQNVNNWDLVDCSAGYIVGGWLDGRPNKMKVLLKLTGSDWLWDRRIAMIATFYFINQGRADEALVIAEKLLNDKHDLIQKAVGWMLRELGKRVGEQPLTDFLDKYAATMPRTTLRYAIEHFNSPRRSYYMGLAKGAGVK